VANWASSLTVIGDIPHALPPEGNLLAVAHYLEALDWQREYIKIHAILGGKNPHPQTYLVGGMAIPVHPSESAAINTTKIAQLKSLVSQGLDFVSQVYLPDLKLIAGYYKAWANLGAGVGNYLSYGDFPTSTGAAPGTYWLPQGIVLNKNIGAMPNSLNQNLITEYVSHSWYSYTGGDGTAKHPYQGETTPNYTGPTPPYDQLNTDGKYSWLKTPRYNDLPMEVGSLARMVVAYAAGHTRVRELVNTLLSDLALVPEALFSTLGRIAARGIETLAIAEQMGSWVNNLETNMNTNNLAIHNGSKWNPATWPNYAEGWGTTEAPRGGLGHWVKISNGKIVNYQAVVPTTWNGSPRDSSGKRGPFEESLIGTPLADPTRPLEILRTIHSFDPCLACSVHLIDTQGSEIGGGSTGLHITLW
jgi:[NiFe] hydrogenase large subunit/hydrogenase large subunit